MKTQAANRSSILIFLSLLLLLVLSGCSAETKAGFLHLTGIISDEDYQTYVQLANEGMLGTDNTYAAPELGDAPELLPPEGSIHVTFAENSYIDAHYYRDAELTEPIDPKWCYLMPGDCIYAPEPDCEHPSSQWYKFDRFSIYACDESGRRSNELSWSDETDPSLVLRVPADQTVSEVSVIPLGKYEKRMLELTDYYIDSTGHHQELKGTWIVNDTEVSTGRIEVSPVESLSIDYKYDDTKYEYAKSSPDSFYNEKGLVRFEVTSADQDIGQYSVELRPLEGTFAFDASQYPAENGTVTFWYNGTDITRAGITYIRDGDSLTYALTPAEGYHSSENADPIVINASDPDKTRADIRKALRLYPDKDATVYLPQPDMGGAIIYTADGKILSGQTCTLPCGTDIAMEFKRWDGWITDPNASKLYRVEAAPNQTVSIGSDLEKLFTEAESHKPTLHFVVSDDMKDAEFAIATSSLSKSGLNYADGNKTSIIPDLLGQNDREIFGGDKIGTGNGIKLTVTNDTPSGGEAMKLEIITRDSGKNEHKTIQYITDLSQLEDPIPLYSASQRATSSVRYESVTIKASKVEVSTYKTQSHPYASISAKLVDEDAPHSLRDGDVLESSREVEITITPDNGYYIEGSKSNSDTYSEKMKYSKWEKESAKILEKHPAQKIWYVTLDTSDSYGTCVYKVDGIVRSGRVGIREEQKLTLEYALTDSNYQISRKGVGGFFGGILHNETENISIPVSGSLDGQTIRRSDYITIEQKEG